MRRRILYLAVLLSVAFIIIAFLVYTADFPNKHKNGFNRHYLSGKVIPIAQTSTRGMIQDIAGATATRFYFTTNDPEIIVTTIHTLHNFNVIRFPLPEKKEIDIYYFTAVDYPYAYIYAYNLPAIITVNLITGKSSTKHLPGGIYSNAQSISNNTFVLRKLSTIVPDQFFVKVNTLNDTILHENNISEVLADGGMSTDGLLHYDSTSHLFTYLHYYNNRYFSFDSTLHAVDSGRTIDTFSHFRFELSDKIAKTQHVFTSQGPDKMINAASCVSKGLLYVHSTLKADNDEKDTYQHNIVIDVYEMRSGKYKGSFIIPEDPMNRINKMMVVDNKLLMNFKDHIAVWSLANIRYSE